MQDTHRGTRESLHTGTQAGWGQGDGHFEGTLATLGVTSASPPEAGGRGGEVRHVSSDACGSSILSQLYGVA